MSLRSISTPTAPQAIGPYSQAVVAGGFVFCSGQVGLDPGKGELVSSDVVAQARQALANLSAVLEAAGSGLGSVVRCTVFLTSMDDFAAVNGVYGEMFGAHRPARATVQVSRLPREAKVEIDAIGIVAR
jgi:2-iminobutanoate/2-iminopropanoate deaminase